MAGKRLLQENASADVSQQVLGELFDGRLPTTAPYLWHFDYEDTFQIEVQMVVAQLEAHRKRLAKLVAKQDLVLTWAAERGETLPHAVYRVPAVAELLRLMAQVEATDPEQTGPVAAEALVLCDELIERYRSSKPPDMTFPKSASYWACSNHHEGLLLVRSDLERGAQAAERYGKKRTVIATAPRIPPATR